MNKIQEVMQQELSRKDFIKYIGIALLSMVGVASFLQNLTNNLQSSSMSSPKPQVGGYGGSPYGR